PRVVATTSPKGSLAAKRSRWRTRGAPSRRPRRVERVAAGQRGDGIQRTEDQPPALGATPTAAWCSLVISQAPPPLPWMERSLIVGAVPQSGHFGSRRSLTSRNRIPSASYVRRRPTSGSPIPSRSFTTSVACTSPITPGSTPRTPASLQEGTRPGGGGVG